MSQFSTPIMLLLPLPTTSNFNSYKCSQKWRTIQLDKKCWGVDVCDDEVYTSCHNNPGNGEVRVLDLHGNLRRRLGVGQDGAFMFRMPYYFSVNKASRKVFVSDLIEHSIICMTVDGCIIYKYHDVELKLLKVCAVIQETTSWSVAVIHTKYKWLQLMVRSMARYCHREMGYTCLSPLPTNTVMILWLLVVMIETESYYLNSENKINGVADAVWKSYQWFWSDCNFKQFRARDTLTGKATLSTMFCLVSPLLVGVALWRANSFLWMWTP